jgi:hypothetical protein
MSTDLISCPHCQEEIDVSQTLYQQVEEQIRREYLQKAQQERKEYEANCSRLEDDRLKLEAEKKGLQDQVNAQVLKELKKEQEKLKKTLEAQIREEQSEELRIQQEELEEKSKQIKELRKASAEFAKLKREKDELEETLTAQAEEKLSLRLSEEKEKVRREMDAKAELKIKELQKQLEDQGRLVDEMKRKQEQGSMQMQGEVQELAIEEWLRGKFPMDEIEEVKKGQRGADCLQVVHTSYRRHCGTIYYESKRTKQFRSDWLDKFKVDIQEKGAKIGVLVTDAMPSDMDRMGLREGIWICSYDEFKGLCAVLRESLISVSDAMQSQEHKGDKMEMLYDFLTSREFQGQVESIVEGFTDMQQDLDKEKRWFQKQWKQREKQIDKVLLGTTTMYGAIKGIAGNSILSIPMLDMTNEPEEPED